MSAGSCFGLSRGGGLSVFDQFIEESDLRKGSFILLEGGVGSKNIDFLSFLEKLHTLVICRRSYFKLMDPGSPKQNMVG